MLSLSNASEEPRLPSFYDPANAARWDYRPDEQAIFEEATRWQREYGIRPSSTDRLRIYLLLIDLQKDFCFPEGSLYVGGRSGRGAVEDNDRIARFIYRNLGAITEISCTMDTHYPFQIFSPAFWQDEDGLPPQAHREVTADDVRSGRLRPNPALADWITPGDYDWLVRQAQFYCEELERNGKYRLYLWPPHCILGSDGYSLAGVIHEARMFHAYARVAPARVETKGGTPLTEYYSVLGPEVDARHDGGLLVHYVPDFFADLVSADAVIIAGQAASHCVKNTIEDLLSRVEPELAKRVYILRDGMSSVTVPDPERPGCFAFDFTADAEAALQRFADAGMNVVESTTPIEEWPGLDLTGGVQPELRREGLRSAPGAP